MFRFNLVALLTVGCVLSFAAAAGTQPGGGTSDPTKQKNAEVLQQLPFADKQDFENVWRGFIALLPDAGVIKDEVGKLVWDLSSISFIKDGASAPDTVNPSLAASRSR